MRAKYCKCKNTYSIKGCKSKKCNAPEYWKQGIGRISAIPATPSDIFGLTFDETFN